MSSRETKDNIPTKLLASLANEANEKMQTNKHILETIQIYQNQIKIIKEILTNNKENNITNPKKNIQNNDFIFEYINKLKSLNNNLNQEIKKTNEKNNDYKEKLFDNNSIKQPLEREELDNFILKNTLRKLNDEILRYNSLIKTSREHSVMREIRRDTLIDKKSADYIIYDLGIDIQRNMLLENRAFNICVNKIKGYQRKIKENKKKAEKLKYYIEIFRNTINKMPLLKKFDSSTNIFQDVGINRKQNIMGFSNNKNKKFQEDENNFEYRGNSTKDIPKKNIHNIKHYNNTFNSEEDNDNNEDNKVEQNISLKEINNNKKLLLINKNDEEEENENENEEDIKKENINKNNIYKKNKKKNTKKLELLSLDELFDLSNYEGENEAIIDEELHSNDEATFETKIIPQKKIINDYIKQIKHEVPSLNFSQIEFNKAKVMNEADLYSLQRRNFEGKKIDTIISNIKKKIKKLEKRKELNMRKYIAMRNFINETKDNYNKILRPLKIKSTVEGGNIDFKIQNLLGKNKNKKIEESKQNNNIIEEELVGSDYSDEDKYEEENVKTNEINIIGDEDSDNDVGNNNVFMKTQVDIKTEIGLNLNNYDKNKKNNKRKIKYNTEDNSKFNSK